MSTHPITPENQQLKDAYRRQVSMNHALLKALAVGVCILDDSGKIVTLNDAGARMLGWSESFVREKHAHEIFECLTPESDYESAYCPIHRCEQTRSLVWTPQIRFRTRAGEWCWVELSSLALDDVGGSGMMMTFRDLSTERQLREDSHKLASIPEESPFPIIEVDMVGNLLYANAAMIHLMHEIDHRSSWPAIGFPLQYLSVIQECLTTNIVQRDIEVHLGPYQYVWVFSPHPALGLVRAFGMDVSDRKLAADELAAFADRLEKNNRELDEALVKAEAATKAKAAFLATMSHEIRTPLNGVIGMTEMLLHSSLTSEQAESVSLMRSSGESLLTIINDILDFSKIEAGKLHLEIVSFEIRQLLEDVLDVFAERAHNKSLDFASIVSPDVPESLVGDPNRLRQILTNFIGNAIKFTEQGEVLVRVERLRRQEDSRQSEVTNMTSTVSENPSALRAQVVHVPSSASGLCVRLSVCDTGIGISEHAQQHVFQAFSQADVSTTRKYGGTGLGLAISRQLVELMGGVIGVEASDGGGATFWCHIPFDSDADAPSHDVECSPSLAQNRVLCVGSPSATSQMLEGLCHELGAQWAVTADCTQARSWLRAGLKESRPYTTVLVDSLIPDAYRLKFINAVKTDPLLKQVNIVMLVNRGMPAPDQKGQETMIDAVLTKPVHRAQLQQCLDRTRGEALVPQRRSNETAEIVPIFSGLSVLVAEDNLVNQKVVSWALKKIGCHVTMVGTGREAVRVSSTGDYDVIFMDWQMPEMDGLEATRAIRAREALGVKREAEDREIEASTEIRNTSDEQRDTLRVPIIGMTANAMKGDREECLHAGMDDYMAKPIRVHQLSAMLSKWLPTCLNASSAMSQPFEEAVSSLGGTQTTSDSPSTEMDKHDTAIVYDVTKALDELGGDWVLLQSLVMIFLDSGPKLMESIHTAYEAMSYDALWNHAHQLKGSLGALHALDAAHAATRLEKAARSHDHQSSVQAYVDLQQQFSLLIPALERVVSQDVVSESHRTRSGVSS
ncbi:response regulator [Nitrospira sp. M1]